MEPIMDVAHLGHVELLTPRFDDSLRFFTEVMGMTESGREGGSAFLRVMAHAYAETSEPLWRFLSERYGHVLREFARALRADEARAVRVQNEADRVSTCLHSGVHIGLAREAAHLDAGAQGGGGWGERGKAAAHGSQS